MPEKQGFRVVFPFFFLHLKSLCSKIPNKNFGIYLLKIRPLGAFLPM